MAFKTLISMIPYQLVYRNLNKKLYGLLRSGTRTSRWPEQKGKFRLPNLRNGGRRLTTVPSYTRNEPNGGTIRYFSLTLTFLYFVMVSFIVSGKALT
jgi:hypothetical protein